MRGASRHGGESVAPAARRPAFEVCGASRTKWWCAAWLYIYRQYPPGVRVVAWRGEHRRIGVGVRASVDDDDVRESHVYSYSVRVRV